MEYSDLDYNFGSHELKTPEGRNHSNFGAATDDYSDLEEPMLKSPERENLPNRGKEHLDIFETSLHSNVTENTTISRDQFRTHTESEELFRWDVPPITLQNQYTGRKLKVELLRKRTMDCSRRKDLLHLLLSFPMKSEAYHPDFLMLRNRIFNINQRLDAIVEENTTPDIKLDEAMESLAKDVDNIEYHLDKYDFYMNIYHATSRPLPRSGLKEALVLICGAEEQRRRIIDSAICQVTQCIKGGGQLTVIGISGYAGIATAGILTKAVENISGIKTMFGAVIGVSVSPSHSVIDVQTSITQEMNRLVGTNLSLSLRPYKVLLFLHCSDEKIDLHDLRVPEQGLVVLTAPGNDVYKIMPVDLEIKMEDHLLPWKLFWENVRYFDSFQQIALQLIEACQSHLLAIVLLARALKSVTDVAVWKHALEELTSSSVVEGTSKKVMVHVLKFVWERKSIVTRHCIRNCTSVITKDGNLKMSSLVSSWIEDDLIETEEEGEHVLRDLMDSFLLEEVSYFYVRMREETRDVLLEHFIPHLRPLHLRKEGSGLSEGPEVAEWDAKVINLNNTELSDLPEKPSCAFLVKLFLQNNNDLMEIPPLFFECMPMLRVLDLSYTSIKSLPPSISRLVSLQEFLLRGCELLMDLPPEIGTLLNLQLFDLEGTEIMNLPHEMGKLTKLECLRVSFYGYGNSFRESNQIKRRIPLGLFSSLCLLKELSIDVNPDDGEWVDDVADFIPELHDLRGLMTLKLYLPKFALLHEIKCVPHFKLTVGLHKQRIIPCLPHGIKEEFEKQENYVKYSNGEDVPTEIQSTLRRACAFFLDRHRTAKKLSEFGIKNMVELKFCLLAECNELETIVDGGEPCTVGEHKCESGVDEGPVLESLEYLGVHCMMNLRSIWEGPNHKSSLAKLKSLALHDCPNLSTIFTTRLLGNLDCLEELTVEECPKINSLVSGDSTGFESSQFLPHLKKISLLDLPELVSICSRLLIAPKLETVIIYDCPMLEFLSPTEFSSGKLKVIKGEIEWWEGLMWPESEWSSEQKDYLASVFVELKRDASLMDQLEESGNSL